ncbi:Mobile element protein [Levilactobacillus zymae]|uniref:Mobile element protein n=1 Tax=Levilactobacillus zymae TaxID=267363 RepID=A0A1Y6JZ06_9LACO|nr:Mobile element protein [Levilactobacillus zymae]
MFGMSQDQSTRVLLQIKDENIKNLSTKILPQLSNQVQH